MRAVKRKEISDGIALKGRVRISWMDGAKSVLRKSELIKYEICEFVQ